VTYPVQKHQMDLFVRRFGLPVETCCETRIAPSGGRFLFVRVSLSTSNANSSSMNAVTIDFTKFRVVTSASRNCHFFVNCARVAPSSVSLHLRAICGSRGVR